jgi:hypothetical protein
VGPHRIRERVAALVAKAEERTVVSVDPKTHSRAFLVVGNDEWSFPIPIVRHGARWVFDTEAGRQEILDRRITTAFDATAQKPIGTAGTVAATRPSTTFDSPERAADALVTAAAKYDLNALEQMFGPEFKSVVLSGESAQDRQRAADFVAKAEEKKQVSIDAEDSYPCASSRGQRRLAIPDPDRQAGNEVVLRHRGRQEGDSLSTRWRQ